MNNKTENSRTMKDYGAISAVGIAMGAADVVPGVSGGTMAFILGVYEELLSSIKSVNIQFVKLLFSFKIKEALEHINYKFLVSLGAGIGASLITLSHLISWLLENHPIPLFAFFFGLVIASIVAVSTHVKWNIPMAAACAGGTAIAYYTVRMVPMDMPNDPFTLFWCAAIAIMAMILPGISGSFILFILGQYKYVIDAVKKLDILTLIPFAIGALVGLLSFSHILTWLLKKYHQLTITMLVGFMIGSLWKIWPFRIVLETAAKPDGRLIPIKEAVILPDFNSGIFWLSFVLAIAGFFLISWLDHMQSKSNPLMKLLGK